MTDLNVTRRQNAGESIRVENGGGIEMQPGSLFELGGVEVTASAAEVNVLDGITADVNELNILDGVTATAAELNLNDLSAVGALVKVKKIAIGATPTGSEQDSTFDLPAKSVVLDVFVDVTTAEATGATKTLDVGLLSSESGGDADGFLDGVSVAATGLVRGAVALDGGSAYWNTNTRGVLLSNFVQGTDGDDRGLYNEKPHLSTAVTAKSVTFTAGSADFAEFRGAIYILYIELG